MGAAKSREAPIALDHLQEQQQQQQEPAHSTTPTKKRKRKSDVDDGLLDLVLRTPKRLKLRTTSKYIYETLFLEGKDSDIVVEALGRRWRLHKHYLSQSAYFSSMFGGGWRESSQECVNITVADPNVTVEALDIALGSLYQDEITLEPTLVIQVLATATLLQLDGLIEQCVTTMVETVNTKTVMPFYNTSKMYAVEEVQKNCFQWLCVNLLSHMPEEPDFLRLIDPDLMTELIGSPDLFVMQTEFSVYVLLRLWIFLQKRPYWSGTPQDAVVESNKYFKDMSQSTDQSYLETEEGESYGQVFRQLRLKYCINHHMDLEMLVTDRVVPRAWLNTVFSNQWHTLLRVDQGLDKGPSEEVDLAKFKKDCLRCGRTLLVKGQQHMWRWTGLHMGLDLIVSFDNFRLTLRRNHGGNDSGVEYEALLDTHKYRKVMYKVTAASTNEQRQVTYMVSSGLQRTTLHKNGQHLMLQLNPTKTKFPLHLSFNFLVTSQDQQIEELGNGGQDR